MMNIGDKVEWIGTGLFGVIESIMSGKVAKVNFGDESIWIGLIGLRA